MIRNQKPDPMVLAAANAQQIQEMQRQAILQLHRSLSAQIFAAWFAEELKGKEKVEICANDVRTLAISSIHASQIFLDEFHNSMRNSQSGG